MRGALAVALGGLLLTVLLGLQRARVDTREELEGALALARLGPTLASSGGHDDAMLLGRLRQGGEQLRHLRLEVLDEQGQRLLLAPDPARHWWRRLLAMDVPEHVPEASQTVMWRLDRGDGRIWTVQFGGAEADEEAEALETLADLFALMAASSAAMLLVMHIVIRRAFSPLSGLLGAIARLEHGERRAVQALPTMPVSELESIAVALRHLADSLAHAEQARRRLAVQVQSLQEDERARLAGELHDEFGQQLTALRVDVAWLLRQLPGDDPRHGVVQGMGDQVARIQQDVRGLLSRLRPLGPAGLDGDGEGDERLPLTRLHELLGALVASWAREDGPRLSLAVRDERDGQGRGATSDATTGLRLPRAVVLAVYRLSQEALTNVARHARAQRVQLAVWFERSEGGHHRLHWRCQDDGRGLSDPAAAMHKGSGLAGMQERVVALDGEFGFDHEGPAGLVVWAVLPVAWRDDPQA